MMNSRELLPFQELVRRRSGLQLETLAESSLMLAVQKRMLATKADLSSAYYTRLLADEAEFDELISLLTINETYFYREPQQLELFTERFLPELLATPESRPLRILSAGCSSGEEPYSIAMSMREKYGESACRMASISACDIDRYALARARQAQYSEYSFRALPAALRDRYFEALPRSGYRLTEAVRTMVEFHAVNLLAGRLPEPLLDFDVVFFRNVSIYFDVPSRERILRTLHAAMREGGYLVLGTAETLANDLGVFQLCEDARGFYFVKGGARSRPRPPLRPTSRPSRAALPSVPAVRPYRPAPVARVPSSRSRPTAATVDAIVAGKIAAVREEVRAGHYALALEQLAPLRTMAPGNSDALLLESYALLLSHRFADAAALARQVLERDNWSVDALVLLGLCAKWQDDRAAAIDFLKTAVYARPDCWPAHYHLGGLLHETQPAKARREYRAALLQMTANPDPDGGLRLPLDLPLADIRFLCQQRGAASAGQ